MNHYEWPLEFRKVYDAGLKRYHQGVKQPDGMFQATELKFLGEIGCSAQELYDFIDDNVRYGEPAFETALLVAAARREYFIYVMNGKPSGKTVSMDDLPGKKTAVDGIAWLPRLIVKARLKLRGEMPADLMFGCGGDRPFLQSLGIELSEFLRFVWAAGDDDRKVIDWVKGKIQEGRLDVWQP
ncbi:MAG: DUF5069 domain-containing protein [Verrucomicrobiota bacterium]|nr:DUF5069 domain-containing protein [Verrucomicrobiota bacterium]